jgi:hypothetical protein
MRSRTAIMIGLVTLAVLLPATDATAVCAQLTDAERWELAEVVFEGRALDGPTFDRALLSPARFEVIAYLEGEGPDVVEVMTAVSDAGDGLYEVESVGIHPAPGEVWRIFAHRADQDGPLPTSVCSGSTPIDTLSQAPSAHAGTDANRDAPRSSGLPLLVALATAFSVAVAHIKRRNPA